MLLKIDFRSDKPIYIQIMDQIQQQITSGDFKQGDRLPTVRQLAMDLGINFNTVARAYRLLDRAGLISTQKGRGTYIWELPTEETLYQLRQNNLESLTQHYLTEATRLAFTPPEIQQAFERFLLKWNLRGNPPDLEIE